MRRAAGLTQRAPGVRASTPTYYRGGLDRRRCIPLLLPPIFKSLRGPRHGASVLGTGGLERKDRLRREEAYVCTDVHNHFGVLKMHSTAPTGMRTCGIGTGCTALSAILLQLLLRLRALSLISQQTSGGDVEWFFFQTSSDSKREHKLDDVFVPCFNSMILGAASCNYFAFGSSCTMQRKTLCQLSRSAVPLGLRGLRAVTQFSCNLSQLDWMVHDRSPVPPSQKQFNPEKWWHCG